MVVGFTLFKLDGNPYYSPQFYRVGLAATFAVDVSHIVSAHLTIEVEHRNSSETSWGSAGTFSTISAVDQYSLDVTGLKEILRFKYTFGVGDPADAAAHLLVQEPSWRPY